MSGKKSLILSFLLSIAMIFSMMPVAAFAEDAPVNYKLWIGGTRVTSDAMSGEGWSYDGNETKGTLTLTNAYITGGHPTREHFANIYADGIELTIVLVGSNTISAGGEAETNGIDVDETLTITGSGSLNIDSTKNAIYGDKVIFDNAVVNLQSDYRVVHANSANDIVINGGKVEMLSQDSYGVICGNLIMTDAELTLKTGRNGLELDGADIRNSVLTLESGSYDALYADEGEVRIENSEVNAKCTAAVAINCYSDDCDLVIIGSKVVAESNGIAIWANSINIKGGSGSIRTNVEARSNGSGYPAVFTESVNGITLGDGIYIGTPEGGTTGDYTYYEYNGTAVFDQSNEKATHVIIQEHEPIPVVGGALVARMTAKGSKTLVMKWNTVSGAEGYDIFFSRCTSSNDKKVAKRVATLKGSSRSTWKKSGLKVKTAYKAKVKAWVMKDGKKKYISESPLVHAYTSGGNSKYTNPKSVTVKKTGISLKKGKTYKIKASVNKLRKSKKLMSAKHAAKLRYISSNKSVAKVSKYGNITAVSKGSCTVYVIAQNGVCKKIKVTVK